MMPDEWASIRSIARCVLPVLVGPSTAVTPWPRTTASRDVTEEKEIGIKGPAGGSRRPLVRPFVYHNATLVAAFSSVRPDTRTSLERIASESLTRCESGFVPREIWWRRHDAATRC